MYTSRPSYVTIEDILDKVTEEQIWEHYLGFLPDPGKKFSSPFRKDNDPSANLFYTAKGNLLYKDFGETSMNCWQFVQRLYGLEFKEALLKIWFDMILGKTTSKLPSKYKEKTSTIIQIKKRPLQKEDLDFWLQFGITEAILNEYNVVPITYFWVNGAMYEAKYLESYSYEYGEGKRKLYFPQDSKRRFLSNAQSSIVAGYDQLPLHGDLLIITKSHKDVMTYKALGYNAISPQGEGMGLPENVITQIKRRFTKIIIHYDNDEAGKKGAKSLSSLHGFEEIYTEEYKDISDTVKNLGVEQTKLILSKLIPL